MPKGVFITATGTDIGKTFISGLLVKKMRDYGLNCGYFKPALSGAVREADGTLTPGDAKFVLETAGIKRNPKEVVSYIYEEAVSPHLAAERAGNLIYLDKIKKDFNRIKQEYDYLLTEGCGGIVCPINLTDKKLLLEDIIKGLNLDVIIVADGGLGTINSTVLTVEYARSRGINVRGIILNNFDKNDFMHRDNLKQTENLTGIKVIAAAEKNAQELDIDKSTLISIFKEI